MIKQNTLGFWIIIFCFLVGLNLVFFYTSSSLKIYFSCICMVLSFILVIILYQQRYINFLCVLFFAIFSLPFIHVPFYIFFDFGSKPKIMWALASNPYNLNYEIVSLLAMFGSLGCMAIVFAFLTSIRSPMVRSPLTQDVGTKLNILSSSFLLLCGLFLSIISAPTETVFEAAYAHSKTMVQGKGFDSAWIVGYIFFIFAYCDAWLDNSPRHGRLKRALCLISIGYVVIVLQLMRGDRECLPFIVSLFLMPYFCSRAITSYSGYKIRFLKILFLGLLFLLVNFTIGLMRAAVVGLSPAEAIELVIKLFSSGQYGFINLFSGTWSAVLLTPLSIAGDYLIYDFDFKYGQDYLDLILSIPPGFVSNWLGYVRPWNAEVSPAWEMRYGIGGWHALVLPFRNFSFLGIFLIIFLFSKIIFFIEKWSINKPSIISLSLVLILITVLPHWLWYGEKALVNSVIVWIVIALIVKFLCSVQLINKSNQRYSS